MKSKLCWIPFIPLTIAAAVFRVLQVLDKPLGAEVDTVSVSHMYSYIASFLILGMFVVNIIFVAMDRKTSPVYLLTRNVPTAVFSMLAAATVASMSTLHFILNLQAGSMDSFTFFTAVMGLLAAICLVFVGMSHLQGRNFLPRMGVLFLTMPVWAGMMLIREFLNNRTLSIMSIDPFVLFSFTFAMIFLFKLSMIISTVKGKNPVKAVFLYGMPLAGFGFAYGIGSIVDMIRDEIHYTENVTAFIFLALAAYIVSFAIELTRLSRTNEEQIIKFDLDDYEEEIRAYGAAEAGVIVTPDEQTGDYDYDYSVTSADSKEFITDRDKSYEEEDGNDYIYGYGYGYGDELDAESLVVAPETEDDDAIYVDSEIVEEFENKVVEENNAPDDDSATVNVQDASDEEQMKKINRVLEDL